MTLNSWKIEQQNNYNVKGYSEYVFESNNKFIIVFDKNMNLLNYEIFKEYLFDKESVIVIILELSNIYKVHSRINKDIYKELFYKFNKYINNLTITK